MLFKAIKGIFLQNSMLALIGLFILYSKRVYISNTLTWVKDKCFGDCCRRRSVIIVRGLPGSGKTKFIEAHIETQNIKDYAVCSANDFFKRGKKYRFNPRDLPQAHSQCMLDFVESLSSKTRTIFVNNPNSLLWEYQNYVNLAYEFGYDCKVYELVCQSEDQVDVFRQRCNYKVNYQTCKTMYDRWEEDEDALRLLSDDSDEDEDEEEEVGDNYEGDSLPYPKKTLKELDDELDEIASNLRRRCKNRD